MYRVSPIEVNKKAHSDELLPIRNDERESAFSYISYYGENVIKWRDGMVYSYPMALNILTKITHYIGYEDSF